RRADENVDLAIDELQHDRFQLVPRHLSVSDADASFRDDPLQPISDKLDVVDAVVNEIDLPVAIEFPHDRLPNQIAVESADARRHRHAIGRSSLQVADVANAKQ